MANIQESGLRWWGNLYNQGGPVPRMSRVVASSYSLALFTGDAVAQVSDGTVALAAANRTSTTTLSPILGIADGFQYTRSGDPGPLPATTVPASTAYSPSTVDSANATRALFIPALPGFIWEADGDDGSSVATLVAAINVIGENVTCIVGATGNATTGMSGNIIDISTHATTNTLNFRIHDIVSRADVDYTATRAKFLITLNTNGELPPWTATGV